MLNLPYLIYHVYLGCFPGGSLLFITRDFVCHVGGDHRWTLLAWRISSIANPDPGTSAFLTLHSEKVCSGSRIPNPYFWWLNDKFSGKKYSTLILSALAKKKFFTSSEIKLFTILWYLWLQKMVGPPATLRIPLPFLVYHSVFIVLFFSYFWIVVVGFL